ncbi:hypothetical protein GCM10028785_32280 [Hydrogenophaga soli]
MLASTAGKSWQGDGGAIKGMARSEKTGLTEGLTEGTQSSRAPHRGQRTCLRQINAKPWRR